jgi:protocatechuate 3,4-dioxygenase beta subunit
VLVCPRGVSVLGTVFDANEQPLANASIYVSYTRGDELMLHLGHDPKPNAKSDEHGRFRLQALQPGSIDLLATYQEADSDWTSVAAAAGSEVDVTLRLHQGGRVAGLVDPSQGTLSGRQIDLYSLDGLLGWRTTKSDARGRFVIEHVTPQDYIIELKPAGYPEQTSKHEESVRKQISVREGETTDVVLGEDRGSIRVTGSVVRAGRPVIGLEVRASPKGAGEDRHESAKTGDGGRFELDVNGPGEYSFTVLTSELWNSYVTFDRTVLARDTPELTFEVPGGVIQGRILSPDGKPVREASVTVLRASNDKATDATTLWERLRRTHTDSKGEFEFSLLAPGTYVLRTPDGFWQDSNPPRVPYGGAVITDIRVNSEPLAPIVVQMAIECRISCRVFDAAGSPVPDAAVQVYDPAGVGMYAYWELRTDMTGTIVVESLAPGTYTVAAQKKGHKGSSPAISVQGGATSEARVDLP